MFTRKSVMVHFFQFWMSQDYKRWFDSFMTFICCLSYNSYLGRYKSTHLGIWSSLTVYFVQWWGFLYPMTYIQYCLPDKKDMIRHTNYPQLSNYMLFYRNSEFCFIWNCKAACTLGNRIKLRIVQVNGPSKGSNTCYYYFYHSDESNLSLMSGAIDTQTPLQIYCCSYHSAKYCSSSTQFYAWAFHTDTCSCGILYLNLIYSLIS